MRNGDDHLRLWREELLDPDAAALGQEVVVAQATGHPHGAKQAAKLAPAWKEMGILKCDLLKLQKTFL